MVICKYYRDKQKVHVFFSSGQSWEYETKKTGAEAGYYSICFLFFYIQPISTRVFFLVLQWLFCTPQLAVTNVNSKIMLSGKTGLLIISKTYNLKFYSMWSFFFKLFSRESLCTMILMVLNST